MTFTKMFVLSSALLLAVGCSGSKDNDGDGLTNAEERELGTDKDNADSDGDGYLDADEVAAGTDPTDSSDQIYGGYWSFNADKDNMGLALDDFSGGNSARDFIPRVTGRDQHRNLVDLYDFFGQDKPVIIDVSAFWCGPCQAMAAWLEHDPQMDGSYLDAYSNVRTAIDNGDVTWVTFLSQGDVPPDNALPRHVRDWYGSFPHDSVPVIVDVDQRFADWMQLEAFPTLLWVNPDGSIHSYRADDNIRGLDRLSAQLDEVLGN